MTAPTALIPGLDDIVKYGDPIRRAEAMRKISDLFVQGADHFSTDHVDLFDDIFVGLVPKTDIEARGELAERLSVLPNAPPMLVNQLVRDEEIAIAGPLLRYSPVVADATLVEIARARGQTHLFAISERSTLSSVVTDVIVRRGDSEVVHRVAENSGAQFSTIGYTGLLRRSGYDGTLAVAVCRREDFTPVQMKDMLSRAGDVVRRRIFDAAPPAQQALINRALSELTGLQLRSKGARDFTAAQRAVRALGQAAELNEGALLGFARAYRYEETIATLSAMSGVRISTVDHLMRGDRDDPLLILGKSINISWATVRALMGLRLGQGRMPAPSDIEEARLNFERLVPATAQRVLTFWQTRDPAGVPV
jgi:uncharacterized protein (DUF2336 family)